MKSGRIAGFTKKLLTKIDPAGFCCFVQFVVPNLFEIEGDSDDICDLSQKSCA
jgi:hypothetical protein